MASGLSFCRIIHVWRGFFNLLFVSLAVDERVYEPSHIKGYEHLNSKGDTSLCTFLVNNEISPELFVLSRLLKTMSSPVENIQYDAAFSAVSPSGNAKTLL